MKTTRNMMMSLVLAGSMVLGASIASAQTMSGRQRPTTSSSSSASRSSSNSSSVSSQSTVRTATPQRKATEPSATVQRSSEGSSRMGSSTSRSASTTTTTTSRPTTTTARPATGASTVNSRPSTVTARPATGTSTTSSRPSTVTARPETRIVTPATGSTTRPVTRPETTGTTSKRAVTSTRQMIGDEKPMNAGDGRREAVVVNGSQRNRRPATNGSDNGGVLPGKSGNDKPGGNVKPGSGRDNRGNYSDNRGGNRGGNRPNVSRPEHNPYRDHFRDNYSHNNWSRPLPPPARPYRPAPLRYYRPVVPAHYRPYAGAPVIDRILGLNFGSLFNVSLNYLYTNNYYIDGYDSDIIYLRDVRMLNLFWPDVMLCYDSYGRLANAQFIVSTGYADRSRYNRLYHDLCAVYGPPISVDAAGATWFGGNTTGYVTLSAVMNGARFYTTLSVGY